VEAAKLALGKVAGTAIKAGVVSQSSTGLSFGSLHVRRRSVGSQLGHDFVVSISSCHFVIS
jgi:hypothetical protein